ncbi:MAG TPA: hypothetical protein VFH44_11715 [Solirubrobacterales bacterium]|nr:hypothetical protein [Solirubrobacterales bacterium]
MQEAPTTDEVAAPPGLSDQEQDRPATAGQANVNPDHYGNGGEPAPDPSQPSAEGAREEIDGPPNRNPKH